MFNLKQRLVNTNSNLKMLENLKCKDQFKIELMKLRNTIKII